MAQCTHPDCPSTATAKGLCAKHYMRLRRHGDAGTVRKAGRKEKGWNANVRQVFNGSGISPRSLARYMRAVSLLHAHGIDSASFIIRATRPNGSMNMARLEEMAETAVAFKFLDEHPELLEQDDGDN